MKMTGTQKILALQAGDTTGYGRGFRCRGLCSPSGSPLWQYGFMLLLLAMIPVIDLSAASLRFYNDINLGEWNMFRSKWTGESSACIEPDANQTQYRIKADGLSASREFQLVSNSGYTVSYTVKWHSGKRLTSSERLKPAIASKRVYTYAPSNACAGSPNAKLSIDIKKRDLEAAPPGVYRDTVMVTLAPI